jgi:dipeptidase E
MRLLLTSAGIKNRSIRNALVDLTGRPIEDCDALCIPTATYAVAGPGPVLAWNFVSGRDAHCPMCELGWRSVGVLELTALPSLGEERWRPWVDAADVLLVNGGDTAYLAHWLRETQLLSSLDDTVWVGLSAGSRVLTTGDDGLGLVDFSFFPHLDHPLLPANTSAHAEQWASTHTNPAYAIDDETAIRVVDGAIDVVSEGNWRLFNA